MPPDLWAALAEDEEARARYYNKVYWREAGQCAYFLGALSSSGHGRFRAGTAVQWRAPQEAWSFRLTSTPTCSAGEFLSRIQSPVSTSAENRPLSNGCGDGPASAIAKFGSGPAVSEPRARMMHRSARARATARAAMLAAA
jgi:hypothetical protein